MASDEWQERKAGLRPSIASCGQRHADVAAAGGSYSRALAYGRPGTAASPVGADWASLVLNYVIALAGV